MVRRGLNNRPACVVLETRFGALAPPSAQPPTSCLASLPDVLAPYFTRASPHQRRTARSRATAAQVGLTKTKDQLSAIEERAKQLSLDLQRTQMDLLAKTSEGGE
jgi:hypothetical protein